MKSKEAVSKPPYKLGLIGLIPLVGFFVGAGLTLYGIFRYKDRKFIFIGVACMLFTILVYSTLFYVGFKSDFGKKAWRAHAQMDLNTLVQNIEFYKLENGKYPDSLQQLLNKNDFILIYDPTQSTLGRKSATFNYKNLGNHYLLFSSSTDGKPNTADDLYPEVEPNKNIGWVRKE